MYRFRILERLICSVKSSNKLATTKINISVLWCYTLLSLVVGLDCRGIHYEGMAEPEPETSPPVGGGMALKSSASLEATSTAEREWICMTPHSHSPMYE